MTKRAPRLLFTEEELETPELKKPIQKAEKAQAKLTKAEGKIPKKKVMQKQRVYDPKGNTIVTRLVFEETEKARPSKLSHAVKAAPLNAVSAASHKAMSDNDDGLDAQIAQSTVNTAEGSARTLDSARRSLQDKPYARALKAERAADRANIKALYKQAELKNDTWSANPYSKWQQKRAIKKEYAAAKTGKAARGSVKASEITAEAAKKTGDATKRLAEFIGRKRTAFLVIGALAVILLPCLSLMSSCSMMVSSLTAPTSLSTYPSADADMLAAEAAYLAKEQELQNLLDTYEQTHDYDEVYYTLDEIEHDPYVLISMLTAMKGGAWTVDEVGGILDDLFARQYILAESVKTEKRYRTETRTATRPVTDPYTGEYFYDENGRIVTEEYSYSVNVPYNYTICTVTLENYNLSHIPVLVMGENQLSLYAMYMSTLGNRPDLFRSAYISRYYGTEYPIYEIPAEALEDEQFAMLIKEAEKYLGYPYVWGGSKPSTSFDCSGFVSYALNHCGVGWNLGRLSANGLRNACTYVSPANAKPGDLIFFEKTYKTTGASHVGIYVGNNMMLHCGDPIHYTSINTSYWKSHFLSFGRLPKP